MLNLVDVLIIGVLALVVALVVRGMVRGNVRTCDCSSCGGCCDHCKQKRS